MIDDTGAAPAAAEPVTPSPSYGGDLQSEPQTRSSEPSIDRSKETARASVERAFAELDRQDEVGTESSAGDRRRDEYGRFRTKDTFAMPADPKAAAGQEQVKQTVAAMEAPSRFSSDARIAWKDVPDSVKGEVGRAFREMEAGLGQYQQVFEPLKPFFQMAQEKGVEVHDALRNYVALDLALASSQPQERLAAIEHLLDCAGITPRDYAAFIMGQPADQAQTQNDQIIRGLRQEISTLRNQLGGVAQSITQRREQEVLQQVEDFARTHPRLDDATFANTIVRLLNAKMADTLESAYDMAERLSAAVAQPAASTAATTRSFAAQTRNGNLSVTGSPAAGSNPAKRKAPQTARESVDNAFASLGLG